MTHAKPTTRLTLIAAMVMALAAAASGDVVTLRRSASVAGSSVKLRDVADLDGPAAEKLAFVEVAVLGAGDQTIGMADVKRRLDEADVHWGLVTLRGATRITIKQTEPTPAASDAGADTDRDGDRQPGTHIAANVVQSIAQQPEADAGAAQPTGGTASPAARSVRQLIVQTVLAGLLADPADVRLTFADDAAPLLDTTEAAGRFEIEPIGDNPIGRIPLIIRRYEAGRLVATERTRVDVAVRRTAVVARRNIGRGQTVTESDVGADSLWVDSPNQAALTDPSAIIGQRCVGMIRQGNTITAADIQPPIMVRRGQVVTVRCVSGSLVLKTVARALDDGVYGELVQFRNERTREQFAARVTGVQQAVLSDQEPAPAAEADPALTAAEGGTTR